MSVFRIRHTNRLGTVGSACTKRVAGESRNTVVEKPVVVVISGGSDGATSRIVAAQVDAYGIQWVVRESIRPSF